MQRVETELLASAGRLLLEYNESTGVVHRTLAATARTLGDDKLDLAASYGGLMLSLGDDPPLIKPIRELRYNANLQARVHTILSDVRRGTLDPTAALDRLNRVEVETPAHSRWAAISLLGLAAACLARILGADFGAVIVVGISTGLGLLARRDLGRRHFALLSLPFAAAFIGAALGGVAIRRGWTLTPGLALIVPALMLVPGPHLINGLVDLVDNYVPMSVARLALATAILLASALGIVLGMELTLPEPPIAEQSTSTDHLNLISDMLLAGVVTCGFAMYYNAAWAHIGMAALGGMAGHGLRYLSIEVGCRFEVATFLGGLAVGIISAVIAQVYKVPFAVIAFAGAVTMMPGVQIYRALGGSLQIARLKNTAGLPIVADTMGNALQSCLVVGALALGLVLAARVVLAIAGESQFGSTTKS